MKKNVIWILAVALIAAFIWSNHESEPKQTQVFDVATMSYANLENHMIYKTSELIVLDRYATKSTDGKINTHFYLAMYYDCNDQPIAVSMSVRNTDAINQRLLGYYNDDTQGVGDCVLDCYVKTTGRNAGTGNSVDNDELDRYFMEAISTYSEGLGEDLVPLGWAFTYHCANTEDPLK